MSPTYDFHCLSSKCPREGEAFEENIPIADRDTACVRCPVCGSNARRQVVPSKAPMCVILKKQETSDRQIAERVLP